MRRGDSFVYDSDVFPLWDHGSVPGSTSWDGTFGCADDLIRDRNRRNENFLDLSYLSGSPFVVRVIYLISGILDLYDHHAGHLLLSGTKKGTQRSWVGLVSD